MELGIISLGPLLTKDPQMRMCEDFSNKDIKDVMFSILNTESPGPDGYGSCLFKTTWSTTGPMVCSAIRRFFQTRKMPRSISATRLVILPKASHPDHTSDFRPISCCNVLYKCISKFLCQRIKEVLPYIINPSKGAFI